MLVNRMITAISIAIALGIPGSLIYADGEDTSQSILLRVSPEKTAIFSGEPCVLVLCFENKGNSDQTIDLGWDGIGALSFRLTDQMGKVIAEGRKFEIHGGLSRVFRKTLPESVKFEHKVVLNQWLSTGQPPGDYTVHCEYNGDWPHKMKDESLPPVKGQCSLRILPVKKNRLEDIFQATYEATISADGVGQRSFAGTMLCYSDSPLAVPWLIKLMDRPNKFDDMRYAAIVGLARIGSIEAVNALRNIVEGKADLEEGLRREAIIGIFEIEERTQDPDIIQACKPITENVSRPQRLMILD